MAVVRKSFSGTGTNFQKEDFSYIVICNFMVLLGTW